MGYDCVAINNDVPDFLEVGKKIKHQKVKSPEEIKPETAIIQKIQDSGRPLRILSRFTTTINNNLNSTKLNTTEIQCYDIVAVRPTTDALFQNACRVLDIDVISLNLTEKLPFYLKRSSINVAIERGLYFEIMYSPAIRDQTMRRYIISNACDLVRVTKGKNVIITSGTDKSIELRGPYDIANLAQLFGMTFDQAKDAVSRNCRSLMMHAESRRAVKSTMNFTRIVPEFTEQQDEKKTLKRTAEDTNNSNQKSKKAKTISAS
ncbi:ribonuclease P protein subunit p30 [Patella vulgata]|uniref:ribonuclease P protein subunit p30 n=1 Tax=Patella vulgata TaxID=6465 RepID=UPI0021802536|nr:ribonuclease P protein subunit p30 [Patella vulgata]